ncbi:MAG TPA: folylpolyglutamate synthase/dihydrofolate synthase family protein [Terriglobales bacterium]|nr:folylpolyglutamate synthase/dihydrofolate synthase family protein [Terriglobales bacterium]
MSYETAVARMYALGHELANTPSHKFDLAHMRALLGALNHPEQKFPGVLIAGTNGKGSTAATLASILRASGLRTGLYTSPHLVRMNERIRISGTEISDNDFAMLHDVVDRTAERLVEDGELPWHPSFFEMLTAIAFEYFAQNKVGIAVLEVGMGGRLDATNVIEPRVSVITDISLDHQKFLGNTVAEIAREKAGIIRPGGVVVTLPQHPQANNVIGNRILELGAQGMSAVPYVPPVSPGSVEYMVRTGESAAERRKNAAHGTSHGSRAQANQAPAGRQKDDERNATAVSRYPLQVMGQQILVDTPLVGRHQLRNIALAIATAEVLSHQGFAINPETIERGICETRWPGRFEVIRAERNTPEFVFDVAHNPAGAWALRSTLSACYEDRPLTLVFGAMSDKAIGEMAEILFPLAERVIVTRADNPRSATPGEIREAAARTSTDIEDAVDVASALNRARSLAGSQGVVVVTGSIYIVGEAMRVLGIKV